VRPAENDRGCFGVWVAFRDSPRFQASYVLSRPHVPAPSLLGRSCSAGEFPPPNRLVGDSNYTEGRALRQETRARQSRRYSLPS
jgi:hypothetical protein